MPSKARIELLERQVDEVLEEMRELRKPSPVKGRGSVVADLFYRAEEPARADGYGRGHDAGSTIGGGSESRPPTGALAGLSSYEEHKDGTYTGDPDDWEERQHEVDVIAEAVAEIANQLGTMVRAARVIRRKRQMVMNTAAALRGREATGGACICCGDIVSGTASDRLVTGLDHKCYVAWGRFKDDHPLTEFGNDPHVRYAQFIAERRLKQIIEAGQVEEKSA